MRNEYDFSKAQKSIVLFTAIVLGFILLATACGGSGTGEPKASGFLKGAVTIGPLCPVEPCEISSEQLAAAYAARKVIVYNAARTSVVKELTLGQNGAYSVELDVGHYIVDINHIGIDRSPDVPKMVIIDPGQTVTVDITIDTGLR